MAERVHNDRIGANCEDDAMCLAAANAVKHLPKFDTEHFVFVDDGKSLGVVLQLLQCQQQPRSWP